MPSYEYRSDACRIRMTVWARTIDAPTPRCQRCGGSKIARLLSAFAAPRSEQERMEALADPSSLAQVDDGDPRSVARWMHRMGREPGEDPGDGFEDDIERGVDGLAGDGASAAEDFLGANTNDRSTPSF
jgi:putative FmdB family regulatory protein